MNSLISKLVRFKRNISPNELPKDLRLLEDAGLIERDHTGFAGSYSITPKGLTCLNDFDDAIRRQRIDR